MGARLLLLLFGALSIGCSRADYDLLHVFDDRPGFERETGQVGDTTRPFVAFAPGETRIELGPVRRGFLRAHLAIDGAADAVDATAEIALRGAGFAAKLLGEDPPPCRVTWTSEEERSRWQECRLPIPRDIPKAQLVVAFDSPTAAGRIRLRVASAILAADEAPKRPDVFVIVLDTARADVFRTFDPDAPAGERLAELARDGVVFDDLRAPSSWTRASVATLLTGLSQRRHQVFDRLNPLPPEIGTLQGHLREHGYYTTAWSTNPNILPIWGFAKGFDRFVDAGVANWQNDKADADAVLERAPEDLAANRALQGLYYLHFMDPHHPYRPGPVDLRAMQDATRGHPERYPSPLLATPVAARVRGEYEHYLGEIRDLDRKLGGFIDHLKEIGVYEDALILVVSDHGEEFLDHGELYHGVDLYEEALRVPGILKLPGNARAGTRITRSVGLADLLPTVSRALGITPPGDIEGRDVFGEDSAEIPQVAQLILDEHRKAAVKHDGWKLIVDYISGESRLFHLVDDPKERHDRFESDPERAAELRALLDRMAALHQAGWHLRGCGCVRSETLRFAVTAKGAEIEGLGLEEPDAPHDRDAASLADEFEVSFVLKPTAPRQERFGRKIKRFLSDEDELVLRAPSDAPTEFDLSIRPLAPAGLRLARGNGEVEVLTKAAVARRDDAQLRIDVGEPIDCRPPLPAAAKRAPGPPSQCEPYVRIWFVAPPRAISESSVDPNVSERLKALGYTW